MNAIFYVTRQRNGWSVEVNRMVRSGHACRERAIERALRDAEAAAARGESASVRIQEDAGLWREARSFSPKG